MAFGSADSKTHLAAFEDERAGIDITPNGDKGGAQSTFS